MYLLCITDKPDGSGRADYRQGIVEGFIYRVADDHVHNNRFANGKKWQWELKRFRELNKVEVVIALGKQIQILDLP